MTGKQKSKKEDYTDVSDLESHVPYCKETFLGPNLEDGVEREYYCTRAEGHKGKHACVTREEPWELGMGYVITETEQEDKKMVEKTTKTYTEKEQEFKNALKDLIMAQSEGKAILDSRGYPYAIVAFHTIDGDGDEAIALNGQGGRFPGLSHQLGQTFSRVYHGEHTTKDADDTQWTEGAKRMKVIGEKLLETETYKDAKLTNYNGEPIYALGYIANMDGEMGFSLSGSISVKGRELLEQHFVFLQMMRGGAMSIFGDEEE